MTKEQVINKIKKLLALSSSPNEEEAKSAMEMAQKLMREYSVSVDPGENKIIEFEIKLPISIPNKLGYVIANEIAKYFGVFFLTRTFNLHTPNKTLLVGYESNCKVASHAIDCILNQGVADFNALSFNDRMNLIFKVGYWNAFLQAIYIKFQSLSSEITKYEEVMKELSKYKPGTALSINTSLGAAQGSESGNRAQLRSGVGASGVRGLL